MFRNLLTAALTIWMLFVLGFYMLNIGLGWAIIFATLIMLAVVGLAAWAFKKWFNPF